VNETTTPVWYALDEELPGGRRAVRGHAGAEHPDGTRVDSLAERAAGTDAAAAGPTTGAEQIYRLTGSEHGLAQVAIARGLDALTPLWFVWVDEPRATPVAGNLVAYPAEALSSMPPGTIVSGGAFRFLPVPNDAQVGAVRWYRDGLVHQIYVAHDRRRQNVGSALLMTASAWHTSNGWPGRLHGDGRRTDLGQKFVAGLRFGDRAAPHSELMPPMD